MASGTNKQCTINNNRGKDFLLSLAIPENEIVKSGLAVTANGTLEILSTRDDSTIIKTIAPEQLPSITVINPVPMKPATQQYTLLKPEQFDETSLCPFL